MSEQKRRAWTILEGWTEAPRVSGPDIAYAENVKVREVLPEVESEARVLISQLRDWVWGNREDGDTALRLIREIESRLLFDGVEQ